MWACTCLLLLAWAASLGSCWPADDEPLRRVARQQPIFGITHMDIRDAIVSLERSIKSVSNKLDRHEAREAQLADFSTKTLADLSGTLADTGTGIQAVARQLAIMEERLLALESLIQTTDARQSEMLEELTQALNEDEEDVQHSPNAVERGGARDNSVLKVVKKLNRKMTGVEAIIQRDMAAVTNEVRVVGESLGQHMELLRGRHDRLDTRLTEAQNTTQTAFQQLADSLAASSSAIQEQVQNQGVGRCRSAGTGGTGGSGPDTCLEALDLHSRQQEENFASLKLETQRTLQEHLATLQTVLLETYAGQALLNASVASLTESLHQVNISTQGSLGKLTAEMKNSLQAGLEGTVTALGARLQEDNSNIMDMLDDRASQTENLHNTVLENYSELSSEINSLKKVEQVMIHTADSVLDTKRSIEFGIQQIIVELSEIVKSSGSTINSTLSDQISNISFAILKNQTSALTNMTAKMEQEISQVWRQIGIMYQQMSQSVDLLDQLKDTTKEHMNASLSRVGNMDGTVGKINTKVADVESNLNYLLGRLSLVVSEFNLMKSGVGEELMRLRDNLAKENNSPVEFAEGREPPSASRYDVSNRR